jgi:hypothetical protein
MERRKFLQNFFETPRTESTTSSGREMRESGFEMEDARFMGF